MGYASKVIAQYTDLATGTVHEPGDELFITGREQSIYYPRPEHSLIKYGDRIIHYAVAIPEGEGRYVLNRLTGDVRIEHGPSMFLPDPREEVVVRRILSDGEVSLLYPGNAEALRHNQMLRQASTVNANDVPMTSMSLAEDVDTTYRDAQISSRLRGVGSGEAYRGSGGLISPMAQSVPTKGMPVASAYMANVAYSSTTSSAESAAQALVGTGTTQRKTSNTPPRTITLDTKYDGVVSVDVWTGYAALLVRKNGDRRVVVGPQTVLLEYDERPMMLELSTGTPKTDEKKLKTGFLRVINNSVSDTVTIETADSFQAQVTLRYHLNFTGDSPEVWFNVENYVQFLAERTRSMIRREAKKHTMRDIRDNAIDVVRTLILGEPVDGVGRPGRTFEENGMMIFDLDVETPVIQGDVDRLLRDAEQLTLHQSLELDQQERELAHRRRMEEIERELQLANAQTAELRGQLILQDLTRSLAQNLAQVENRERVEEIRLAHKSDQQMMLDAIAAAELARDKAVQDLDVAMQRAHAETCVYDLKSTRQHDHQRIAQVLEARFSETAAALDTDPSRRLPQRRRQLGECADQVSRVIPPVLSPSRHRTRGRDTGDRWDTCVQQCIRYSPLWLGKAILVLRGSIPALTRHSNGGR